MNDKTNITPLAAAKPANGKTPAATQKAPAGHPGHFGGRQRQA